MSSGTHTVADRDRPATEPAAERIPVTTRVQRVLHGQPALGPLAVLAATVLVFGGLNPRFIEPANLGLVLQQVTVIALLAVGQALIILTAGIDLSVGAVTVFTSIIMAKLTTTLGLPGLLGLLIGIAAGVAMGLINGVLVTRLKLPPFIVTLGTLSIFFSLNLVVSQSQTIRAADMPSVMSWTGNIVPGTGDFRLTYGSLLMLLVYAVFAYALRSTAWGKHVYASGDDYEAARLAGIRTTRVVLSVYIVAGGLYGLAAWVLIGRLASASPNVGTDYNLDAITAVVIGGLSLFGGRGRIFGALIGALIVGSMRSGLQLAGVDAVWQGFAIGALVLAAVAVDQWIRRTKP